MIHIQSLTELQSLDIAGTKLTDVGLKCLQGLTKLRSLCVDDTGVTDKGIARFKKLLPKCELVHIVRGETLRGWRASVKK